MENVSAPAGVVVTSPTTTTVTPEMNLQPQPSAMATGMPQNNSGGSIKDFIDNINWVEMLVITTGTIALLFVIQYYRTKRVQDVADYKKINDKVVQLQSQVEDVKSKLESNSGSVTF
jgi:hypothetical protein